MVEGKGAKAEKTDRPRALQCRKAGCFCSSSQRKPLSRFKQRIALRNTACRKRECGTTVHGGWNTPKRGRLLTRLVKRVSLHSGRLG